MRASITKALLLGSVLWASAAMAEPDPFGFGNGGTPPVGGTALSVNAPDQVINKYARVSQAVPRVVSGNTVSNVVEVTTSAPSIKVDHLFKVGDLVMVIQMGADTPLTGGDSAVNLDTAGVGIGRWELARVTGVGTADTDDITLDRPLVHPYPANWTQVVLVPEYTSVSVLANASITAEAWDHDQRVGGVLAFLSQGVVTLGLNAKLNVDGKGFRGAPGVQDTGTAACTVGMTGEPAARRGEGVYIGDFNTTSTGKGQSNRANAGGGGLCVHAGGGGGANAGKGGQGGHAEGVGTDFGGKGGEQLNAALLSDRLTMGGGGGAGHGRTAAGGAGGHGGGIIFMRAGSLTSGQGQISASGGNAGVNAQGAGGGGGGGTLHLRLGGAATCSLVQARGGAGGNNNAATLKAPGGGGGGGRVLFQAESSNCPPSAAAGLAGTGLGGAHFGATPDATTVGSHSGPALFLPQKYEVPPKPTVVKPAHNAATNLTLPIIEGTTVPFADVRIYVNNTYVGTLVRANGAGVFSYTYAGTPLSTTGTHTVAAEAIVLGAVSARSDVNTFRVDTTLPVLNVTAAPTQPYSRTTTATFEFNVSSETGVRFECSLDSTNELDFKPCVSPWVFTAADRASPYTARIRARDLADNLSTVYLHQWTVDSTPPGQPSISAPTQNSRVGTDTPTISGIADTDTTLRVSLFLDNNPAVSDVVVNAGGGWSWTSTALGDGPHLVTAVVTDAAGNQSPVSATRAFVVDDTSPAAPKILKPAGNFVNAEAFSVEGSAEADGVVTVTASLWNGTTYTQVATGTDTADAAGAWSVNLDVSSSVLSVNGVSLRITAQVQDQATPANSSSLTTDTFTLDLQAPTVTFDSRPPPRTNAPGVAFTFHSSEPDSFFNCQLDGGDFEPCLSPHFVTVTTEIQHTLCVTATDPAGYPSAPECRSWTLDGGSPARPVILTPLAGANPTQSARPQFTGTAEDGSTIQLYIDGVPLGTDTTPSPILVSGSSWSAQPGTGLGSGFYVLTATATDEAGNVSEFSLGRDFSIDMDDPLPPVITSPVDDTHISTARPVFRGTAEPHSKVVVTADNPGLLGETTADANGLWTLTLAAQDPALAVGARTVTATAEDAAENTSVASAVLHVTVDLTDPGAPSVTQPPARTGDSTPVISGTSEANANITVYIDDVVVGTTLANGVGSWSFTPQVELSDGAHEAKATARDASNRVGLATDPPHPFTVDTTAPGKPVITVPVANAHVSSRQPRIEGRAEAGAIVTILVGDDPFVTGSVVGTATANAQGQWVLSATTLISEGPRGVVAYATDDLGNVGAQSDPAIPFTSDITPPGAPTIVSPAAGAVPVATTSPVISGTAEPGSTVAVTVLVGSTQVATGTTTASTQDGAWSYRVTGPLDQVPHIVRAQATDRATNTNSTTSVSPDRAFTVDTVAPNTEILKGPALVSAATSARFVVRARIPNTANTDASVVAFDLSRDGEGLIECVLDSSTSGCTMVRNTTPDEPADSFVITLTGFAPRQSHQVQISARDPAGNRDATPAVHTWQVVDGSLTISIKFGPNATTNKDVDTFVFDSERPGAIFMGTLDGQAFTVSSGNTSLQVPLPDGNPEPDVLADGLHTLSVQAVDPDNLSNRTSLINYQWTVDTAEPAPPTINVEGRLVGNVVRVNTATPKFFGMAEAGGTVTVLNNVTEVGTATVEGVEGLGAWSRELATPLGQGTYTFNAQVADRAGNVSNSVPSPQFIVDLTKPTVGVVNGPPAQTKNRRADFTFSRSEDVISFECSLDNAPFVTCGTNLNPSGFFDGLAEGPHNIALKAMDLAGNETLQLVNYSWRVDLTLPIVTLASKPDEYSPSLEPTFEFQVVGEPATYRCSVDDSAYAECPQTFQPPGLGEGNHVLKVIATDLAGNDSARPAEYRWVIDRQAPPSPVLEVPSAGGPVGNVKPVFQGTAEQHSTVTVLVDGVPVATKVVTDALGRWDVPSDVTLTEEQHTVSLMATDRAGNPSPATEPVSFWVDVTGPNTVIESGPESRIRSTSASFTFSSEEGATFECSLNRGAFDRCPDDGVFGGLEEGGQSLEVRAKDIAGNVDQTPATYSWRVYLGSDIRTRGGGLSCATTEGGGAWLSLLGLGGLVLLGTRRRRR